MATEETTTPITPSDTPREEIDVFDEPVGDFWRARGSVESLERVEQR